MLMITDQAWVPTSEHATTPEPSSFNGLEEDPSAPLAAVAAAAPGSSPGPPGGLVDGTYILAGAAAGAAALAALALIGSDPPDGPAAVYDRQAFASEKWSTPQWSPTGLRQHADVAVPSMSLLVHAAITNAAAPGLMVCIAHNNLQTARHPPDVRTEDVHPTRLQLLLDRV